MLCSFARSKPSFESVPRQTSTERSFVYVDSSGESRRRYDMWYEVGISSRSLAEQLLEPAVTERREGGGAVLARLAQPLGEGAQGDSLLLFVPLDGIGDARELGRE